MVGEFRYGSVAVAKSNVYNLLTLFERQCVGIVSDEGEGFLGHHLCYLPASAVVGGRGSRKLAEVGLVEAAEVFLTQYAVAAVVDHFGKFRVAFGFGHDCVDGFDDIDRQEDNVGTGADCANSPFAVFVVVGDGLHIDAVGEDKSVEGHLLPKDGQHDAFRERRGHIRSVVEGVDLQVSHHHSAYSVVCQVLERKEVDAVYVGFRVVDDRQVEVAVDVGVSVSREVLADGNGACTLHTAGIESRLAGDTFLVLAERAASDDRVERVVVDVAHRGEVDMDAHLAALSSHLLTKAFDKGVVSSRESAHKHLSWKGIAVGKPHTESPFGVDGDEQRDVREVLVALGAFNLFGGSAFEKADASHAEF